MMNPSSLRLTVLLSAWLPMPPALAAPAPPDVKVHNIRFEQGGSQAVVKGSIKGYGTQDFRLSAAAGQSLQVDLKSTQPALQFNVIAPDSNEAMFMGETAGSQAKLVLPIDGVYTIRTYLMRSAARRSASGDFSLAVSATGAALPALPGAQDAKVAGTAFHATASLRCKPPYAAEVSQCEAGVIRRGRDGTATVVVRGPNALLRQILLVKGRAVTSNVALKVDSRRDGDTVVVEINGQERYDLPDAFLTGG